MTAWAGWPELVTLLTSVAYGIASAVVPVVNAELYVAASQVSGLAAALPTAVGIAIGQTVGKALLFLGVRQGREFRLARHRRSRSDRPGRPPKGPTQLRLEAALRWLLSLVGRKRWGLPITFVAAVIGIPPLYGVALLAGATTMRIGHFAAVVLVGRGIRFLLVALGVHQLVL